MEYVVSKWINTMITQHQTKLTNADHFGKHFAYQIVGILLPFSHVCSHILKNKKQKTKNRTIALNESAEKVTLSAGKCSVALMLA